MNTLILLLAGISTVIAAYCFYLGTWHQQCLRRLHTARSNRMKGAAFMVLSLLLLMALFSSGTAVFTALVLLMLAFIAVPCAALLPLWPREC
ncbi:hypothetical protein [Methylobacter sp.]|uniref:hypothetical protein n=1 Tax=Methylobacter sp. TaxID=2051955 RepID=UPI002FDE2A7F